MRHLLKSLWEEVESWGLRLPTARSAGGPRVLVFSPLQGGKHQLIGELFQQDSEFVFRYAGPYKSQRGAQALPAFPDLSEEYRSPHLFPFFAARLPPIEREDVRDALRRLHVHGDDPLRILGKLAKKGIANPYEFELAESV